MTLQVIDSARRGLHGGWRGRRAGLDHLSEEDDIRTLRNSIMNKPVTCAALAYAAIGVASLLRPSMVPAIFGGAATTPDARTEVRAVYGGLPIAIATSLATDDRAAQPIALLSFGMAAGRLAGILAEARRPQSATLLFLGVETVLAGLLISTGDSSGEFTR